MNKYQRLPAKESRRQILETAIVFALKEGYYKITLVKIAHAAGCSYSLILYYFKSIKKLRQAVVDYAVENKILPLLAQLLSNPELSKIPKPLRAKVMEYLAK